MSGVNETRFSVQHESCECKCGLNESVCNSKQKWNQNECKCEYKYLDPWSSFENGYMCNPCTWGCECKVDEDLDTKKLCIW